MMGIVLGRQTASIEQKITFHASEFASGVIFHDRGRTDIRQVSFFLGKLSDFFLDKALFDNG